ncbi:MAG: hypothetical protein ACN6OS_23260, partial [Comamonas testosteroni]|uniref:hypothetical protein n=1 Tax=Comamonas testosteroni TaxID=285 RepID=UPI003D149033
KKRLAQKPCDDIRSMPVSSRLRDEMAALALDKGAHPTMASVYLASRKPRNFPPKNILHPVH